MAADLKTSADEADDEMVALRVICESLRSVRAFEAKIRVLRCVLILLNIKKDALL